jgi:hypothetical protein
MRVLIPFGKLTPFFPLFLQFRINLKRFNSQIKEDKMAFLRLRVLE